MVRLAQPDPYPDIFDLEREFQQKLADLLGETLRAHQDLIVESICDPGAFLNASFKVYQEKGSPCTE